MRNFVRYGQEKEEMIKKQLENFFSKYVEVKMEKTKWMKDSLKEFFSEFNKIRVAGDIKIRGKLERFFAECNSSIDTECERMLKEIENKKPIEPPQPNYLEIFKIKKTEKTYTRFLEWVLKNKREALTLFLKHIVDSEFGFELDNVKVWAEKPIGKGLVPDIQIKGKNFLCIIEIKIRAREEEDQTLKYYKTGIKMVEKNEKPFFIYLTLCGQEAKSEAFKNVKWCDVIEKVFNPLYQRTKRAVKEILQVIIYSLQENENEKIVDFFKNQEKYRENKLAYYLKLKQLSKEVINDGEDK